jgi:hypothetical protein
MDNAEYTLEEEGETTDEDWMGDVPPPRSYVLVENGQNSEAYEQANLACHGQLTPDEELKWGPVIRLLQGKIPLNIAGWGEGISQYQSFCELTLEYAHEILEKTETAEAGRVLGEEEALLSPRCVRMRKETAHDTLNQATSPHQRSDTGSRTESMNQGLLDQEVRSRGG